MPAHGQRPLALEAAWARRERGAFEVADTPRSARLRAGTSLIQDQLREIGGSGSSSLSIDTAAPR